MMSSGQRMIVSRGAGSQGSPLRERALNLTHDEIRVDNLLTCTRRTDEHRIGRIRVLMRRGVTLPLSVEVDVVAS
ncbi:MAG: hypothetical protein JWM36_12 [Hyphomicrobiales bacterium]|nr:hypothetical protein [Hyphomicrobiales bacterium]